MQVFDEFVSPTKHFASEIVSFASGNASLKHQMWITDFFLIGNGVVLTLLKVWFPQWQSPHRVDAQYFTLQRLFSTYY